MASVITLVTDIFYPSLHSDPIKVPDQTGYIISHYCTIMKVSLKNVVSSIPIFFLYEQYSFNRENNNPFICNCIMWLIITDALFYILHRSLHHPKLYHLHKLHHQYKYTYGPTAIYSSISEFYISNILPNVIAFETLQLSLSEMTTIIVFQTFYTVIVSHSGYKIFEKGHLKHHLRNKEPYGLFISDAMVENI